MELPGDPALYLPPPCRGAPRLDVLGVLERPDGTSGALVRTLAGFLVQVNGMVYRRLPQREVEAALAAAVELRRAELVAAG